ncbi:TFIIF-interacting CTD phosphatase [Umbelopsis sp. PMI_123]|nr:TFIIF-interacting CTD phosphatase [Umbelopsis sp. PMI_123]
MDQVPCSHAVQYNGLCAICGQDVYVLLGGSHTEEGSRANINMSHNVHGLMVNRTEAERLEQENAARLLETRRLSLIVDLDQTIIHAACDPTVGEWMNDKNNTNHPATKDIKQFVLPGSPLVYYIKLRPKLQEFLKEVTKQYELHIYTMGTRNYAEAVANKIDPDKTIFRERILSRDESGSLTQKNIQRLFPCDTSMVVVMDDRSDVWNWSPNLIKVKPYDFFVGIGDINSVFLPKREPIPKSEAPNNQAQPTAAVNNGNESTDEPEELDQVDAETLAKQQREQDAMVEQQQQARPLLQKQNEMSQSQNQPLLVDNDEELDKILEILKEVHYKFYEEYDKAMKLTPNARVMPDVTTLLPNMKADVLKGTVLLFSSVIPLGQDPQQSDIWRLAVSFGAQCTPELTGRVTHVVAGKAGTQKVNAARKHANINIVRVEWLLDSTSKWERLDESQYLLPELSNASNTGDRGSVDEDEIDDPESTPLELDDDAFLNRDSRVHRLSVSEEEVFEHYKDVDWNEADQEVDEVLALESGTDFDDEEEHDDEDYDEDDASGQSSSDNKKRNRSARSSDAELDDSSEDDTNSLDTKSRLAKRKRASRKRKSGLSKQVNLNTDSTNEDDSPARRRQLAKSANSSIASTPQRQDNDVEANDSDFLDDLAGELDDEIE